MSYRTTFLILCSTLFSAFALSPPYFSENRRHVAENLNSLSAQGLLTPGLSSVFAVLSSLPSAQLNDALDQLHPAPYSALIEMQAEIGGQVLSLFHAEPQLHCGCDGGWRAWAEPMGNWLKEGSLGQQTGFYAKTLGIAAGIDKRVGRYWTVGGGLIWNVSDLTWRENRGGGAVHRYLGACFADFKIDCFYCGLSLYGGIDRNDLRRKIQFSHIDRTADGTFNAIDLGGQFSAAYLFGMPYVLLYPYALCDFLYFDAESFGEGQAGSLNLNVRSYSGGTIRTEAGIALELQDLNWTETVCVAPKFGIGWAMECPLYRSSLTASFAGEPLSFQAAGWDHAWQLLALDFGLRVSFYGFALSGEYQTEIAPKGRFEFWGQRGDIGLEYYW